MRSITITASVTIPASATDTWAFVADYANDPRWRTGVVSMAPNPPGPVRPGTTTAEELRMAGRVWHNDGFVEAVDPGRSFRWRTVRGADADGARRVVGLGAALSRIDLELTVRPHGLERVAGRVLRRMLQRSVQADLGRLRDLAEAGALTRAASTAA